jgi:hypothetical protein
MHKPGFPCLTIFNVSMPHYCSSSSETVCLKVASHALQAFNVRAQRKPSHAKSDLMLNLTRRRLFVRAVPTDTNPAHLADTWKFTGRCSSASLAGLQADWERRSPASKSVLFAVPLRCQDEHLRGLNLDRKGQQLHAGVICIWSSYRTSVLCVSYLYSMNSRRCCLSRAASVHLFDKDYTHG